ncbi:uncharacterized protein [Palaemon carinicauda]|uniref:uncharacterized protein n=1 Tax=Palaemon carinicauda TaxID=392227 RepID=UPI0035B69F1C
MPHFIAKLEEDIGDRKYSILLDESTDISVVKYLGLAIHYFSEKSQKLVSTFLHLAPLEDCDANGIVHALKSSLHVYGLNLQNMVGIGTDNASVMVGSNNGVYKKLKEDIPALVHIRCVCHSVQLSVSHASKETMPRNLEFLFSETYNWFARSSSRQQVYTNLFKLINDGHEPLKIVQASQTRWLSIASAVHRLCDQWLELKTNFSLTKSSERCYTSEMLHALYCDELNHAYLVFLKSVLRLVLADFSMSHLATQCGQEQFDNPVISKRSIGSRTISERQQNLASDDEDGEDDLFLESDDDCIL